MCNKNATIDCHVTAQSDRKNLQFTYYCCYNQILIEAWYSFCILKFIDTQGAVGGL